jgi:AraC-like DNA-binding protein
LNESDLYREWAPPPQWQHVVACLWEQHVTADRVQRVVPDGHADLLFHEDETIGVVGMADEVALPTLAAGTRLRGVRLRPEAVGASFATSASSLVNHTILLEDVVGSRRARQLLAPANLDAWIRAIQPDSRVAHAVTLLQTCSIAATADRLHLTARQLQRLTRANLGLSPKTYQRILRFQRFVHITDAGTSIAIAAAAAGYADQAHLTREVGRLSGVTPARLTRERRA